MTIPYQSLSALGRRTLLLTVLIAAGALGVRDAAAQSANATAKSQVPPPSTITIMNPAMVAPAVPSVPAPPDGRGSGKAAAAEAVTDSLNLLNAIRNRAAAPKAAASPNPVAPRAARTAPATGAR